MISKMHSILSLLLLWMFTMCYGLASDQSLSFSTPIDPFTASTASFWHGTIQSKLLEENLEFQLYLNKPQGLLFYAIDNFYQSLWVEFDTSFMILYYYNFKTEIIEEFKHETGKLCRLTSLEDSQLTLKFSLAKNALMIKCNRNEERIFYSPNIDDITDVKMRTFLEEMKKPVPKFSPDKVGNDNVTHFWIGNSPTSNKTEYQNRQIESQSNNLLGCVQYMSSGSTIINLATTGSRFGNMVEASCRPVCGSNICQNEAICVERWRQQFKCECGLSKFIGTFCNETYGVEFNDDNAVTISEEFKIQKFQISFNHLKVYKNLEVTKVFSIQFIFDQNIYVYINEKGFLLLKFTSTNYPNIEETFRSEIEHNRTYTIFMSVNISGINVKLADSNYRYVIDEKTIVRSVSSLVSTNIIIADSHSLSMKWMKRFKGCISNVKLTAGKKTFTWNQIPNFDRLPSCVKKVLKIPPISNTSLETSVQSGEESLLSNTLNKDVSNANITYIIIGTSMLLVVVIAIIIVYKCKRVRHQSYNKNSNTQNEKALTFETITYQNCSVPNSPPIHYKPPYKARSISYSSNIGKSVTSLPISITPTLVTPEDNDC